MHLTTCSSVHHGCTRMMPSLQHTTSALSPRYEENHNRGQQTLFKCWGLSRPKYGFIKKTARMWLVAKMSQSRFQEDIHCQDSLVQYPSWNDHFGVSKKCKAKSQSSSFPLEPWTGTVDTTKKDGVSTSSVIPDKRYSPKAKMIC